MRRRYMDAMALVRKYGKPDIFLTMMCNPNWDEIKNELYPGQTPQDRPDLITWVFQSKVRGDEENVDGERHTWEGEGLCICSGVPEEGLAACTLLADNGTEVQAHMSQAI